MSVSIGPDRISVIVADEGPGIRDIAKAMEILVILPMIPIVPTHVVLPLVVLGRLPIVLVFLVPPRWVKFVIFAEHAAINPGLVCLTVGTGETILWFKIWAGWDHESDNIQNVLQRIRHFQTPEERLFR
jgi:hypothetical protein